MQEQKSSLKVACPTGTGGVYCFLLFSTKTNLYIVFLPVLLHIFQGL